MDLAGINFSDFVITCSIYSKIYNDFNISGHNFLRKWGTLLISLYQVPTNKSVLKTICMNNHIYSTLFKIQEIKSDKEAKK